jgi:diguanylate cyclase (GGDEF)-like protein
MSPRLNQISLRLFKSELQRLSTLSAASVSGFGLLLLGIIAFAGWSSNDSAAERERTLLQNGLNRSIVRILNEQKSVAWWDELIVNLEGDGAGMNADWVNANIGVFLTETYDHSEVYVLDAGDRPVFAFAGNAPQEPRQFEQRRSALHSLIAEVRNESASPLKVRPDEFGEDQDNYRILAGAVNNARWSGHILSVGGRPAVAAAITIVPNVDMSLLGEDRPRLLISVRYIDAGFVGELERSLLLKGLLVTDRPPMSTALALEPFDSDDGVRAGYFAWESQRPGRVLLNTILPLVAAGVAGVGILAGGMLRRLRRTSLDLAQREAEARHAAQHDSLSGLPNRTHFADKLTATLEGLDQEHACRHVAVAYVDIDRFKDVNDTLGHHAGDALINAVTRRLKDYMRADDFLARYGGDEFAILWTMERQGSGRELAERIRRAFIAPFDCDGHILTVTASVGVATAPEHGSTADELMRHADIALYEAKNLGRDRAEIFHADLARQVEERRSIELDLRAALQRNGEGLRLDYQPVISCETGLATGLEALLRWRHPKRGDLPPGIFIPIAEQCGLMPALGELALSRAMRDSKLWPDLSIAVNLSPVQFRQSDLEALLRQLLREHDADPCRFTLEITESVLLESCDRTGQALEAIHHMGFRTALDDFGTGYSSLSYLCKFRFDKIKIDRTFVSGIAKGDNARKIVNAVIGLGKGLGMDIVAEGVETEDEARIMYGLGCNELQGYFFARPMDVERLNLFLAGQKPRFVAARFNERSNVVPLTVAG